MTNHTALLRLGALLLMSTIAAPAVAQSAPASRPPWREPRITYVDPPTQRARDTITWAVDRYREADLQLPDLAISFPEYCSGKAALYHVGHKAIDFCFVNKHTMLHELAHAWDDTSGAVDREAFLQLRGLHVWWGGIDMPSSQQGAEQLAQIIDWGLSSADSRPIPQIPRNSLAELKEAFDLLTSGVVAV